MKKFFMIAALVLGVSLAANAQPRAIGGRLGYGLEVSYQHSFGQANMLQAELGIPGFNGLEGAVTYDWIFPINSWQEKGSWNWYAGVGGGVGMWGFQHPAGYVGVAGRIGVEYNFWFPMNISLDWRPIIGPAFGSGWVGYYTGGLWQGGIALSIRYLF